MVDKWICSWNDLDRLVQQLIIQMSREKYKPDFIVGISRGGLVPAIMLSHHFDVPMVPLVWSTRDFIKQDEDRIDQIRDLVQKEEKNVLVVDDICDTGKTFISFQESLMEESVAGYAQGVDFCSLHIRYGADFTPEFYVVEIPDESWIVYPYEIDNGS